MRKYFYFRTDADEDDDDAKSNSAMIPVDRFMGAIPTNSSAGNAANVITLYFKSALNQAGAGQNGGSPSSGSDNGGDGGNGVQINIDGNNVTVITTLNVDSDSTIELPLTLEFESS